LFYDSGAYRLAGSGEESCTSQDNFPGMPTKSKAKTNSAFGGRVAIVDELEVCFNQLEKKQSITPKKRGVSTRKKIVRL
jgi:hypothetical protein